MFLAVWQKESKSVCHEEYGSYEFDIVSDEEMHHQAQWLKSWGNVCI